MWGGEKDLHQGLKPGLIDIGSHLVLLSAKTDIDVAQHSIK